jgi:hypothetical protein
VWGCRKQRMFQRALLVVKWGFSNVSFESVCPAALMSSCLVPAIAKVVAPPARKECPANSGGRKECIRCRNQERLGIVPSDLIHNSGMSGQSLSCDEMYKPTLAAWCGSGSDDLFCTKKGIGFVSWQEEGEKIRAPFQ